MTQRLQRVPRTLRVVPTSDVPVPLKSGRRLLRKDAPAEGFLVEDDIWVRRRIRFGELVEVKAPAAPGTPPLTAPPTVPKQAPVAPGAE